MTQHALGRLGEAQPPHGQSIEVSVGGRSPRGPPSSGQRRKSTRRHQIARLRVRNVASRQPTQRHLAPPVQRRTQRIQPHLPPLLTRPRQTQLSKQILHRDPQAGDRSAGREHPCTVPDQRDLHRLRQRTPTAQRIAVPEHSLHRLDDLPARRRTQPAQRGKIERKTQRLLGLRGPGGMPGRPQRPAHRNEMRGRRRANQRRIAARLVDGLLPERIPDPGRIAGTLVKQAEGVGDQRHRLPRRALERGLDDLDRYGRLHRQHPRGHRGC